MNRLMIAPSPRNYSALDRQLVRMASLARPRGHRALVVQFICDRPGSLTNGQPHVHSPCAGSSNGGTPVSKTGNDRFDPCPACSTGTEI